MLSSAVPAFRCFSAIPLETLKTYKKELLTEYSVRVSAVNSASAAYGVMSSKRSHDLSMSVKYRKKSQQRSQESSDMKIVELVQFFI